jgi:hypothetical protein
MTQRLIHLYLFLCCFVLNALAEAKQPDLKAPIRGWNTWNNLGCSISEELVLEQAQGEF